MIAKKQKALSLFFLLSVSFFLAACGSSDSRIRIEGRFRNMNMVDLYLFDMQNGHKDTISVRSGRFVFEKSQKDTITYLLMFPNYSLLPVFTYPGASIKVEGDASHLRETKIVGTDENDDMTDFRLQNVGKTPPQAKASARKYILDNPDSPVSLYLLEHFFMQGTKPDYVEASKLCDAMNPQGTAGMKMQKLLQTLKNAQVGSKLPSFSVKDTQGKTITERQLHSEANVVCLWSSWSYESKNLMTQLRKMQKEHPGSISVVSICLDATQDLGRDFFKRDSITWPNVCDGKMWQTPLALKMGFATIPANVIADKNGKIVARNVADIKELKKNIETLLGIK